MVYFPEDLILMLKQQAETMFNTGVIKQSRLSNDQFRTGLKSITAQIVEKQITISNDNQIPILLVVPDNLIRLSNLVSLYKIDADAQRIDLKKVVNFFQPTTTNTLHALVNIKTMIIKRGTQQGKADQIYTLLSAQNMFGFNSIPSFLQARKQPKK
jgi:hypothetical protein